MITLSYYKLLQKINENSRQFVWFVVRPDIYNRLDNKSDFIYVDNYQEEEVLAFNDLEFLKAYLNRHNDIYKYVELLTGIPQVRLEDIPISDPDLGNITNRHGWYTACKHGGSYLTCPACYVFPIR